MNKPAQRGFTVVEIVVAVLLIAVLAGVGYLVFTRNKNSAQVPTAAEQAKNATTPAAPGLSDASDLDAATQALDETNLDASTTDSTDLDAELKTF